MPKANPEITPSMKLVHNFFQGIPSFSMMPILNECPYIEVLYNPKGKILVAIGKTKKDSFHFVPRISDDGDKIRRKNKGPKGEEFKMQRVQQESYTEYYITHPDDVKDFITTFGLNHKDFDYKKFTDMELMSEPSESGILTGPELDQGTPLIKV